MANTIKNGLFTIAQKGLGKWAKSQFGQENRTTKTEQFVDSMLHSEVVQERGAEVVAEGLDYVTQQIQQDTVHFAREAAEEMPEHYGTYAYIRESLGKSEWFLGNIGKSLFAGILWVGSRLTSLVVAERVDQWAYQQGYTDIKHEPYLVRIFNHWLVGLFGNNPESLAA